ncbi:predicted protein [Scheffersomyces stipitis CBS 6054]|uniref:Uncharacterized protein n=1 Tax=Scheffersomyces stipitis (strain ATCC 58785 / CBS 6054 / NBRC 10063 / NRRL Y-11545) TaxID=322104 RepID=A3LUR9_PICST|nr:predicted protein [Scheffersomyces stipitis CBS 6054]ABN67010.1 predicted protein [Scheffersomyces stipitis CBS 6054]KAG2731395.1 hypothetical protein G9P44_005811 [Scheffersomyces stipitis]
MSRPPPRSLEEFFYRKLMDSPAFHNWVRKIHARINRIDYTPHPDTKPKIKLNYLSYKPTTFHKVNAFRVIWADEMKRSFRFWS